MMLQPKYTALQRGLSLVELMVGLAIGMFLTVGLFALISNASSAFKVQDDFARMQDNATSAMRQIGNSLRMAGFYGQAPDPAVINLVYGGVATVNDCGSALNPPATNWAFDLANPVIGYTLAPADVSAMLPCILPVNFALLGGTQQVLVTRGSLGYRIHDPNGDGKLEDGLALQRNFSTTVYVQADPSEGLFFYGKDFVNLRTAGLTRLRSTGGDVDIFEYATHVYYIRPCSSFGPGKTSCTDAAGLGVGQPNPDDEGKPIPTLVRQELTGSNMTEVALAEGIERMSILYGIDTLPANAVDGIADTFTASPASAAWKNVVAVKVTLLVRSATPTAQQNDAGKTYDLDGDGQPEYDCLKDTFTTAPCSFKRKVFSQQFQLRNIAQRRER